MSGNVFRGSFNCHPSSEPHLPGKPLKQASGLTWVTGLCCPVTLHMYPHPPVGVPATDCKVSGGGRRQKSTAERHLQHVAFHTLPCGPSMLTLTLTCGIPHPAMRAIHARNESTCSMQIRTGLPVVIPVRPDGARQLTRGTTQGTRGNPQGTTLQGTRGTTRVLGVPYGVLRVLHRVLLYRVLGVPHRVLQVPRRVLRVLHRVPGVLHRVLGVPHRVPGVPHRVPSKRPCGKNWQCVAISRPTYQGPIKGPTRWHSASYHWGWWDHKQSAAAVPAGQQLGRRTGLGAS